MSADRAKVTQRVRILAAAAFVAVLALAAGLLLLGRGQSSPAAVKQIKPLHPVKHHARSTPKYATRRQKKAKPAVKKSSVPAKKTAVPSVIDGMPASLALALRTNDVVVVSLYAPKASVDGVAMEEARQGASLAGAGFVALNVSNEKVAAPLTSLLTSGATAADRVLDDPAVLIFQSPRTLFVRLNGFADRETVAQAASNAGAVKVTVSGSETWASQANALCLKMETDLLGLQLPSTVPEALDWADRVNGVLAATIRGLHALTPPRGRESQVKQMLAYYDQALAGARAIVVEARQGKQPDVAAYEQKISRLGVSADAIARDLGASACGGGSGFLQ